VSSVGARQYEENECAGCMAAPKEVALRAEDRMETLKQGLALVRHHVGQGVEENTPIRHSCDITRFDQGMAMEIEKSDYSGLSLIWHLAFLPD